MGVLVDLALKPGQRDFGAGVGLGGLAEVPRPAGERVRPDVHDRPEAPRGQLLDVPAYAPLPRHGGTLARVHPTARPEPGTDKSPDRRFRWSGLL